MQRKAEDGASLVSGATTGGTDPILPRGTDVRPLSAVQGAQDEGCKGPATTACKTTAGLYTHTYEVGQLLEEETHQVIARLTDITVIGPVHAKMFDWELIRVGSVRLATVPRMQLLNGLRPTDLFLAPFLCLGGAEMHGAKVYLKGTRCKPWMDLAFVDVELGNISNLRIEEVDIPAALALMLEQLPELVDRTKPWR